jgi:type I restriction enzyme S subunit
MREDWIECTLNDIAVWGSGGTPKSTNSEFYNGNIPWLIIGDLNDGYVNSSEKSITTLGLDNSSAKLVKPNSVLIAMYGSIGKLGINSIEVATNQAIAFTKFLPAQILNKYLFHYLFYCRPKLHAVGKGGTQKNISQTVLKQFAFPLIPLPEQRAIVAKIEELFSDLDKGIADLKKAQDQLKVYRQAVLKKAFEGELTKEWREQQTDLPTADELFEQIKEERQKHYEQQIENWKQAVKTWEEKGKEYSRPSKPKKLTEFTTDFEEKILELPDKWEEGVLEYVADAIDPQPSHRTPPKVEGGIPYISIADIDKDSGEIKFDGARKVSENVLQEHINRYKLTEGDFVIGKIGTIGKPFFIPIERFFTLSANVVLVRPFKATSIPKFLYHLNLSPIIEQQFKKGAKATTQAAFGIKKVRLLRVPLCSVEEQHQIVQEIESRLSVCDKVEENINESLEKAKALRQSILKKAFEGTLLSEEEIAACRAAPDYEPASVLLERIKAEKEIRTEKKM